MVMIGYAFMNKVITFYTFYRCIRDQTEFLQIVFSIHFQLEIFWSFLVFIIIGKANQATREVNITCFEKTTIQLQNK